MKQLKGFIQGDNLVCKLKISLYSLVYSAHAWHEIYSKKLKDLRCNLAMCDPAFFTWKPSVGETMINTYIDDGIGIISSVEEQDSFLSALESCFENKVQTDKKNYVALGLFIDFRGREIKLSIARYIEKFVHHFSKYVTIIYLTPIDLHVVLCTQCAL